MRLFRKHFVVSRDEFIHIKFRLDIFRADKAALTTPIFHIFAILGGNTREQQKRIKDTSIN